MKQTQLPSRPLTRRTRSSRSRSFLGSLARNLAIVMVLEALITRSNSNPPHYHVNALGTFNGNLTIGSAINNSGQVAGVIGGGLTHAFLYSNGEILDLGTLGGSYSYAQGINNLGDVTGESTTGDGNDYAFLYSNGVMTSLGTIAGLGATYGQDINDAGQIAVSSYSVPNNFGHALLWSGSFTDLGTLGGTASEASSLNNLGQITGGSGTSGGEVAVFLYSAGVMASIGSLGGDNAFGYGINDVGQITGFSNLANDRTVRHAILYSTGVMIDIDPFGGYSEGYGINNSGQIVGYDDFGAFLYSEKNLNILNTVQGLQGLNVNAEAINDAGQFAGTLGSGSAGGAFIATPFYRQVDPAPEVPVTFGPTDQTKDNTASFGCALVSASNMCRQLIALKAASVPITIMTPALLDNLLATNKGYNTANDIQWGNVPTAIVRLANTQFVGSVSIDSTDYDSVLTEQLYRLGERIVLKFVHTTTDQTTGVTATGAHFVWVIGKEAGDWKIADPGWNSVASETIESLQAHLTGFTTISKKTGHTIAHQFLLDSLRIFKNLDYVPPPDRASHTSKHQASGEATSGAAVSISAIGPVDLLLTDPQGRRLGHNQQSGQDYTEIPGGSYFTDAPILSPDGDELSGGDPSGTKQIFVPSPVVGTYNLAATGTATGSSTLDLGIIGPGGAEQVATDLINTQAGVTTNEQLVYSATGTADLSLSQTSSPSPPQLGKNLTYKSIVTNKGPSSATYTTLTDLLPPNTTFVSAQSSGGTCMQSGNVVSCSLNAIASQATSCITIVVQPTVAETITNSAYVAGFEADPDPTNNSSALAVTVLSPPNLVSAASRLTHPGAGTFDVPMPLIGTAGVEPRQASTYDIELTFDGTVTSGAAVVISGVGTAGPPTFNGTAMSVPLTGVANAQDVTLQLSNMNADGNSRDGTVSASFLTGDTTADGSVNSADISQTKSQSGTSVTASNFREDVNVDGNINSADIAIVKSKSGTALPR